ncbi:MAG: CARDB domain-containing protein [Candidatus Longimicrobiales bacterium M2_2A_002]
MRFLPAMFLTLAALAALFVGACSDSTSPIDDSPDPEPLVVGPDGGTVTAEDVTLVFPPGAVDAETEISIIPAESELTQRIDGTTYDLGPDGMTFSEPVRLTIAYDPDAVPAGVDPATLRLAKLHGSTYEVVPGGDVDTAAHTISGDLGGFSLYSGTLEDDDLELTMDVSTGTVQMGGHATHSVHVTNPGPEPVTDVGLTLDVTGEVVLMAATLPDECVALDTGTGVRADCDIAVIDPDTRATLDIDVAPGSAPQTLEATAELQAWDGPTDPHPDNNSGTLQVDVGPAPEADVAVAMSVPSDPVEVGADVDHQITVTNNGPEAVTAVEIELRVEGDVSIPEGSGSECTLQSSSDPPGHVFADCPLGDLAAGADAALTLTVVPESGGQTLGSTVALTAYEGAKDPDETNNTATRSVDIAAPAIGEADLAVYMIVTPDPVSTGSDLRHEITVSNLGPDPATDVTLDLVLDGDLTVDASGQEGCRDALDESPAGLKECPVGDLGADSSVTLVLVVIPQTPGQRIRSEAEITSFTGAEDPDLANNRYLVSTEVSPVADLVMVSVTADPDPVPAGDEVLLTMKVRNDGPAAVSTAEVQTIVESEGLRDNQMQLTTAPDGCWWSSGGDAGFQINVHCPVFDMAAGDTGSVTLGITPTLEQELSLDATIFAASGEDDQDIADNRIRRTLTVGPATPEPTTPSGQVAFVSGRTGTFNIFLINADGTDLTQLTDDPVEARNPAWSPDRAKLAFASGRSGNSEIYVMNADGTNKIRVTTDDTANELAPAWAPGAVNKIAFQSDRTGDFEIYTMDLDGSGITNLTHSSATTDLAPSWSPDGAFIAFGGEGAIVIVDATGTDLYTVTSHGAFDGNPAWRPGSGS